MDTLFENKELAQEIYDRLMKQVYSLGDFAIEVKKTSLHLTNGTAFLGIHPKKNWLDITIVSDKPLAHACLKKVEQTSKTRWHNDFRLEKAADIDEGIIDFIRRAYQLRKK